MWIFVARNHMPYSLARQVAACRHLDSSVAASFDFLVVIAMESTSELVWEHVADSWTTTALDL